MTILTHSEDRLTSSTSSSIRNFLSIVAASILIALCAPIVIPLPFSPVPIALQPHVCLFLGAFLGSKRGALAVLGFLMQGALGLPVFAKGGLWDSMAFGSNRRVPHGLSRRCFPYRLSHRKKKGGVHDENGVPSHGSGQHRDLHFGLAAA